MSAEINDVHVLIVRQRSTHCLNTRRKILPYSRTVLYPQLGHGHALQWAGVARPAVATVQFISHQRFYVSLMAAAGRPRDSRCPLLIGRTSLAACALATGAWPNHSLVNKSTCQRISHRCDSTGVVRNAVKLLCDSVHSL